MISLQTYLRDTNVHVFLGAFTYASASSATAQRLHMPKPMLKHQHMLQAWGPCQECVAAQQGSTAGFQLRSTLKGTGHESVEGLCCSQLGLPSGLPQLQVWQRPLAHQLPACNSDNQLRSPLPYIHFHAASLVHVVNHDSMQQHTFRMSC